MKAIRTVLFGLAVACGMARATASDAFTADVRMLTAAPHRLTGTDEQAAAFEYVAGRVAELAPDAVITQRFPAVQMRVKQCEAILPDGRRLALSPLQSNGLMLPVTPPDGVSGNVVQAGDGSAAQLRGKSVEEAIVVLDYNCGENWLKVFRMGARAVIFVAQGEAKAWNSHGVAANVNIPRFYYQGARAELPEGMAITIRSELVWEPVVGRNLVAFYKGRNPVFGQGQEEAVVLAAPLDSFGDVPLLSPGARRAANVAGLLKLAARFRDNRPRRHMALLFLDAESQCYLGARRLYRSLETQVNEATIEARAQSFEAERAFLDKQWALVLTERPLEEERSPVRRELVNRLRDRAAERTYAVGDRLNRLRGERMGLRQAMNRDAAPPDADACVRDLNRLIDERLQPEKDEWNQVRRLLGKGQTALAGPEPLAKIESILSDVREDIRLRREELDFAGRILEDDRRVRDLLGDKWISLHVSLLLGDATPRWGVAVGGDSTFHNTYGDQPGVYGRVQAVFMRAYRALADEGNPPALFEPATVNQTLANTRAIVAAPYLVHSGEVAGLFGIYNVCFATCQESLSREGTPDDTVANLDMDRIEAQIDEIGRMLATAADLERMDEPDGKRISAAGATEQDQMIASQEGLSLRRGVVEMKEYAMARFAGKSVYGPTVMGLLPGSSIPNLPVAGALVQIRACEPGSRASRIESADYSPLKPYAFQDFHVYRTSRNGTYEVGPINTGWRWWKRIGFAAVFDDHGRVTAVSDSTSAGRPLSRLNVFPCQAGWMVLPPSPGRDSAPMARLLSAGDNGTLNPDKSHMEIADGLVAWYAEERVKAVKLFDLGQLVALNSGPARLPIEAAAVEPLGKGFSMESGAGAIPSARRSAIDLWRLNESRIRILQDKNIIDSSLAALHGRAEDLHLEAADAPVTAGVEAVEASSFLISTPVYREVRRTIDDLVFAVLILLGLSIPFAFALERVIVGATTIHRQMAWFAGFFVATFGVLFLTHPAFAIGNTPVVVFLGFAILILSGLVIAILMRRFREELKALQGMPATVHAVDVSRMGTLMAAMQMGISTMRRRPLRTTLTAVTIILLTFTILSFASFSRQSGIVRVFAGPAPAYHGVFVHDLNWRALSPDLMDIVRGRWADAGGVYARRWMKTALITRADGSYPMPIGAGLGIDPEEIRRRPDLRGILDTELEGKILLPPSLARALHVAEGDEVLLDGERLRVGRLTDSTALSIATDMDGSSPLPVDFSSGGEGQEASADALQSGTHWRTVPADSVVVIADALAARLGADLRALTVYTGEAGQVPSIAEDMARMFPLPVAATLEKGVFLHILGTVMAASGAGDLLFPILLGGLVIFGTMLGSVADREREIYTFSALGLAPRHVATLFLAEALVYSVIGGMGGYLLAQTVLKVLVLLAEHGIGVVPEMNMSSTNTVITILIVMGTVLVSAIYPAIKASRSANPGLMRSWRPPPPEGDVMDLVFPFTVSQYDITGVVSFLKEHFDNHSDVGLGRFMAACARIAADEEGMLGIRADLTLAPFDLGVSQRFWMRSTPSEIPGIDEVRIRMERTAGQPADWERLNRVFLDDLRRQFLIWRSLPEKTMSLYGEKTLAAMRSKAYENG